MQIAFSTEKLKDQFSSYETIDKAFRTKARDVSVCIEEITDCRNLKVLQSLVAMNCQPLTANPAGQWRLTVLYNYSMIFKLDHDPIPINDDGTVNSELVTRILITGLI